ncbi:MAG TPA: hypothetical protein VJX68_15160 [Candidatus Binatus sp.]|uniref:hypothetical protein n=1 Tax=Candidatus Binatus sp. TaxID=2811406 RepID=UPI002B47228D|nr:hypothetical protein [Candidatus Binatus sp.]HKN14528.1 hypothetical protein [Candidatus Binatus sp.]
MASSARTIGNAFGDDIAFIYGWGSGNQSLENAAVSDMKNVPTLKYAEALVGLFEAEAGSLKIPLSSSIAGHVSMVLNFIDVYQTAITSKGEQGAYNTSLQFTAEFPTPISTNTEGIAQLDETVNVTYSGPVLPPLSGLDLCCFESNPNLAINGICDLSGNCDLWVPLQAPSSDYSNLTLGLFDPLSNAGLSPDLYTFLNTEIVDLSSVNTSTPVSVPPLSATIDNEYTDSFSGSVSGSDGNGGTCTWSLTGNGTFAFQPDSSDAGVDDIGGSLTLVAPATVSTTGAPCLGGTFFSSACSGTGESGISSFSCADAYGDSMQANGSYSDTEFYRTWTANFFDSNLGVYNTGGGMFESLSNVVDRAVMIRRPPLVRSRFVE